MDLTKIIALIGFVILVGVMGLIFVMMYFSSQNNEFPPIVSQCPDYYTVETKQGAQTGHFTCKNGATVFAKGLSKTPTQGEFCIAKKEAKNFTPNLTWDGVTNNTSIECNAF